jgi:cytochrome c551
LAVAVGAIGIGVIVAFLAGYFLGHFTGHSDTTTVGVVTSPASGGGESEEATVEESGGIEKTGEEATGEEKTSDETSGEAKAGEQGKGEGGKAKAAGGDPEAGSEVFATNCAVCHGATGHGGSGGPDLRTMPLAQTDAGVIKQVTNGGGGMPPFKGQLSEEEIEDVAAYVVQEIVGGG